MNIEINRSRPEDESKERNERSNVEVKTATNWVRSHRTELVLVGVGVASIIIAFLWGKKGNTSVQSSTLPRILRDKAGIDPTFGDISVDAVLRDTLVEKTKHAPHSVVQHLRDLPSGYKASAKKIATAAAAGFQLGPEQTWVTGYRTGMKAA